VTAARDPGDAGGRVARRLAPHPSPAAFVGVCVHVVSAAERAEGGALVATPDHNLEAYQREGVARFVDAERARTKLSIAARYTDHDAGFERFRARVLGEPAR